MPVVTSITDTVDVDESNTLSTDRKKWEKGNLLVIGGAKNPPRPLPNASKHWMSTILRAPLKSRPKQGTTAARTPCQNPRNPMRRKYDT